MNAKRPRGTVFVAASLDDYIAREDGSVDWLAHDAGGEDYGYDAFHAAVDVVVMGWNSFAQSAGYATWAHAEKRTIVLSRTRTADDIPAKLHDCVELHAGGIDALLHRLATERAKHLYIDGGRTVQSFLRAGFVDDLIITRLPILLGAGIPLFASLERTIRLTHVTTKSYPTGVVQSHYRLNDSV